MSALIAPIVERDSYMFELSFQTKDQRPLGREQLTQHDLERAMFATWFAGLRHGQLREFQPCWDQSWVEPLFTEGSPPGRTRGFRISVETDPAPPANGMSLSVSDACGSVQIREASLDDLGGTTAWDQPDSRDPTVVIPRSVIDESVEETRAAPDREIGGLLLGHVCRDVALTDLFLEVTAIVSAAGTTDATATSVTFTPESFRKARDLIRLRDRDAIILGFQHSHPMRFCQECPLPTPLECLRKILFFSMDDVLLMERTFPQPFLLGLLTAVEPRLDAALEHPPVRLFGWRHAEVQPRGFHVINDQ